MFLEDRRPFQFHVRGLYTYHGRLYKMKNCARRVPEHTIFSEDKPVQGIAEIFNVLLVCRQIYHEARTIPFSCNTWELWTSRYQQPDRRCGWLRWSNTQETVGTKRRDVIKWPTVEHNGVDWAADTSEYWWAVSLVEGSRFLAKSDPMRSPSWKDVTWLSEALESDRNDVEEAMSTKFGLQMIRPKAHPRSTMPGR